MENVTEELVRQNGNQAAAVMADYAGQGGGGGSTGGSGGVVVQDGNIVNNVSARPATEEDVAKFSGGSVSVGSPVIEINGTIPYVLQSSARPGAVVVQLLTNLDLTEHFAYYAYSGEASPEVSSEFVTTAFAISDDVTLLSPFSVG